MTAAVAGNWGATLRSSAERAWPILVPLPFLLLPRAVDGRSLKVNTLSLVLTFVIVQVGLIVPFIYGGASFAWLRFFV